MTGFQPKRCGDCDHPVGDHVSGRTAWPHPHQYGPCTRADCACTSFQPADTAQEQEAA